ncbi:hypothetical protein OAF16_04625, partial [Flavobacteriales bacterium]|nr:hypothetical protein [Flavobacteriales bacterium]
QRYSTKKELEKRIIKEVKHLVEKAVIPKDFFNDIMNNFYKVVEHSVRDKNLMEIKGLKLVTLLEIDFSNLYAMSERYMKVKSSLKPNKEQYSIYAETEKEINRLSMCEKIINHLKDIKELGHTIYPVNIQQAYNGMLIFDIRNSEIAPNPQWIKQ